MKYKYLVLYMELFELVVNFFISKYKSKSVFSGSIARYCHHFFYKISFQS